MTALFRPEARGWNVIFRHVFASWILQLIDLKDTAIQGKKISIIYA